MQSDGQSSSSTAPHDAADGPLEQLAAVRARTLAILEPLSASDLDRILDPLMSPLAWDVGHIAAFEELWLNHNRAQLEPLKPELAGTYDAAQSPREIRPELEWLRSDAAFEYLAEVRERTTQLILSEGPGDETITEMVIRHEQQHCETILQTVMLAQLEWDPKLPVVPTRSSFAECPSGLEMVAIDGGEFEVGSDTSSFAYDNERPRHRMEVESFEIGRYPVTNGDWIEFIDAGGYQRDGLWSSEGLALRSVLSGDHPGGWQPDGSGGWLEWRAAGFERVNASHPVIHISCFEAEAFARLHGGRLPTEFEWEYAACWDPSDGTQRPQPWGDQLPSADLATIDHLHRGTSACRDSGGSSPSGLVETIGNTWEWTSSKFAAYPNFSWHPYEDYSVPFFDGSYRVLRGASWATGARCASPQFRNWDYPARRQIFSGMRLARRGAG